MVDVPALECLEHLGSIADHRDVDPVQVIAVTEVLLAVGPPVLLPGKGDRSTFANVFITDDIGAGSRRKPPLITFNIVFTQSLVEMLRDRTQLQNPCVHIRFRGWNGDRESQVIVLRDIEVLAAVPVVVPGGHDVGRLVKEEHEHEVIGGDRFAIRPLSGRVEFDVDRPAFPVNCPGFRQTRVKVEIIEVPVSDVDGHIVQ